MYENSSKTENVSIEKMCVNKQYKCCNMFNRYVDEVEILVESNTLQKLDKYLFPD